MKTVKIVVGVNFGDEGKGLMTDYFAKEAKDKNQSCLVICHNGGSQKGHTVVSPSGLRHVFHHFGSGAVCGADTYLSARFIVNPITYNKELAELKSKNIEPQIFVHDQALITTPFDMMLNQIAEEYRGKSKHGSCGVGIFETKVRNEEYRIESTISGFSNLSRQQLGSILNRIVSEYFPVRLKQLGVDTVPDKWNKILEYKECIIENFIDDFLKMKKSISSAGDSILDLYDYVIFEGAQGLLLDQNNLEYAPHLTPSSTGIKNPMDIIAKRNADVEVCYVTRTYMTRHGAGRFDTECAKKEINSQITDLTNIPNSYQDTIRYGTLDLVDLKERIENDSKGFPVKKSLAVTHCNEYGINEEMLRKLFCGYKIYRSDGMTHNDVKWKLPIFNSLAED